MAKNKRSHLPNKGQTIEDVWESISPFCGDLNPPPSKLVLTPRSAQACLKHGVNPEVLRVRPLDSFASPGLEPAVQRLRHETYTQRRFELMRIVRAERKRLVNQEEREASLASSGKKGAKVTPEQIIAQQAKQNATFIEDEEKRMLKMRKRQEKELEQMLSFEAKMREIQAERDRRVEEDRRKQEMLKLQKEKRAKQMAEEHRLRELKKANQAELEEQRRQAQVRAMFEKEKTLRREREARERTAKQEARIKEEERLRKQEEHRLQTQRILSEQQAAIRRRLEDMELMEKERQALVERKRAEERDRLEMRRTQLEARLQRNMRQAEKVEQQRRDTFFQKEYEHEQLRQQHLAMQARERALRQHQTELQEQRRKMVLEQTKRDEERRKAALLGKFENEDELVRRVREAREREHNIAHEKKMLRNQMKLENVERIRRIAEYRRLEYQRKIDEADRRTKNMMERKEELIAMRKENARKIRSQKDKLVKIMEEAKASGAKATKLIQKTAKEFSMPRQSASSDGKRKKSKKADSTMRSQSAAALYSDAKRALGPPPDAPSRQRQELMQSTGQLPYVSPYETSQTPHTMSVTF